MDGVKEDGESDGNWVFRLVCRVQYLLAACH